MTRYMLLVNFDGGTVEAPMDQWKPEEVTAHMDYYRALNAELRETGELVAAEAPRLPLASTSCRRELPPCTTGPPRPPRPTGRRSLRSTSGSTR